jgi:hypothetical protein
MLACRPKGAALARIEQAPATPPVANQESQGRGKQQRAGCRLRSAIRFAHLPGDAVVPSVAARLLSAWHRHSRNDNAAVLEAIVPGHGLSGCGPDVGFPARQQSDALRKQ